MINLFANQHQFDFKRGEQLAMLRDADIPKRGGVAGHTLKAVLRAIDDFGRGRPAFAGNKAIAKNVGIEIRQTKVAIKVLEQMSLIVTELRSKEGRRGRTRFVRIVWSELALLGDLSILKQPRPAIRQARNYANDHAGNGDQAGSNGCSANPNGCSAYANGCSAAPPIPPISDLSAKNRLPQPPQLDRAPWQEAEEVLRAFEIGTAKAIIAAAKARGDAAAAFLDRIHLAITTVKLPENAKKLNRPRGAVAHFLTHGTWPTAGIIDPEEAQRRRARRADQMAAERSQGEKEKSTHDELKDLEAQYGAILDCLPASAREALEAKLPKQSMGVIGKISLRLAMLHEYRNSLTLEAARSP